MTAPKPQVVTQLGVDIVATVRKVVFDYEALYELGYSRSSVRSDVGSRQKHGTHGDMSDLFADEPGKSHPTVYVRKKLEEIGAELEKAKRALQHAEVCSNRVVTRMDASPRDPRVEQGRQGADEGAGRSESAA